MTSKSRVSNRAVEVYYHPRIPYFPLDYLVEANHNEFKCLDRVVQGKDRGVEVELIGSIALSWPLTTHSRPWVLVVVSFDRVVKAEDR